MSILGTVIEALDDVPAEIVRPIVTLIGGIVRLARAGDDAGKRQAALMRTAEDLKRELDRQKFGPSRP